MNCRYEKTIPDCLICEIETKESIERIIMMYWDGTYTALEVINALATLKKRGA